MYINNVYRVRTMDLSVIRRIKEYCIFKDIPWRFWTTGLILMRLISKPIERHTNGYCLLMVLMKSEPNGLVFTPALFFS